MQVAKYRYTEDTGDKLPCCRCFLSVSSLIVQYVERKLRFRFTAAYK